MAFLDFGQEVWGLEPFFQRKEGEERRGKESGERGEESGKERREGTQSSIVMPRAEVIIHT